MAEGASCCCRGRDWPQRFNMDLVGELRASACTTRTYHPAVPRQISSTHGSILPCTRRQTRHTTLQIGCCCWTSHRLKTSVSKIRSPDYERIDSDCGTLLIRQYETPDTRGASPLFRRPWKKIIWRCDVVGIFEPRLGRWSSWSIPRFGTFPNLSSTSGRVERGEASFPPSSLLPTHCWKDPSLGPAGGVLCCWSYPFQQRSSKCLAQQQSWRGARRPLREHCPPRNLEERRPAEDRTGGLLAPCNAALSLSMDA